MDDKKIECVTKEKTFSGWQEKLLIAFVPAVIATVGWSVSLENRIQVIDARQQERTSRFEHLEQMVSQINRAVTDPSPKPETKIAMDGLRREIDNTREDIVRLNDRLNNLHSYIVQTPPYKPPANGLGKRGDIYDTPLVYPQRSGAFP